MFSLVQTNVLGSENSEKFHIVCFCKKLLVYGLIIRKKVLSFEIIVYRQTRKNKKNKYYSNPKKYGPESTIKYGYGEEIVGDDDFPHEIY